MGSPNESGNTQSGDESRSILSFASTNTELEVIDQVDRHRFALETPSSNAPTRTNTDRFRFPVDKAVTITTESLTLPIVVPVCVRDDNGAILTKVEHTAHETFPDDTYSLELFAPIKLCLRVDSTVTVTSDMTGMTIDFDTPTEVLVGAQSASKHPTTTITTTDDPEDVMAAVSTFGAALKTTAPERSMPSFRGHPPLLERGDELAVPETIDPPDTGVRLELPPEYRSIYVAAPLAYYLGASLVPSDTPRLVADTGFEHALDPACGFEREVERILKQVFFLDSLTQPEGLYPVSLHERQTIEPHVDLDFAALYDQSSAARLETYLDVPFSVLEDHLPEWKQTAHIAPIPSSAEMLPFTVNDLAVVRTPQAETGSASNLQAAAVDEFLRADAVTRSSASHSPTSDDYVKPEQAESLEQVWVDEGTPLGASKATITAYRNRLDRTPTDGDIEITVVCNEIDHTPVCSDSDMEMTEERDLVNRTYGSRADLPFAVTVHRDVTTEELRSVLNTSTDFCHYIGHVNEDGFECVDGTLDAATLDTVGVDAFMLNACRSYEQGMALLEGGSIGGIVTLSEVMDSEAITIGRTLARLLNRGFPLNAALDIARDETLFGGKYTVVGDGGLAIAQAESRTPYLATVETNGDVFDVEFELYPTRQSGMGSVFVPYLENNEEYVLNSNQLQWGSVTREDLQNFLRLENAPVRFNGDLRWAHELETELD
jgi:hypothetical protein